MLTFICADIKGVVWPELKCNVALASIVVELLL